MAFWKRGTAAGETPVESNEHALGSLACAMSGCEAHTGLPCAYLDRRGRECGTAWCPEHRLLAGGEVYCRRHWNTVKGLDAGEAALPDRDNRAPSLVAWVGRRMAPSIEEILLSRSGGNGPLSLVQIPVHLVFIGRDRARVWERTWAAADHTGYRYDVTLQVEERRDTVLVVRVGRNVVARIVPPWIEARLNGEEVSHETDMARRQDFYESLRQVIAEAVAREDSLVVLDMRP
ncbi:MAG TPA: hypothetical protein VFC09_14590 [Candidatus Dormibacteraeota bacterium]|nr:hypothetical protein [Candidatus Dormibacteraeota bacterium]